MRDAEARYLTELQHAGRQRGAQSIELLAPAGPVELADRCRQCGADSRNLGQPVLGHERRKVGRERLHGPGSALVGPSLERILPLDLEEEPDLAQQPGDGRRSTLGAYRRPAVRGSGGGIGSWFLVSQPRAVPALPPPVTRSAGPWRGPSCDAGRWPR